MALEYQRYGRDKATLVNSAYISGGEYRSKFDRITSNKTVARVLYSKAKEMLLHRSGTKIEDMCWIDSTSGDVVATAFDEKQESSVKYTDAIRQALRESEKLIAMHTHPASMPPSARDFNSTYRYGYAISLVLCHNGQIFQYTSKKRIDEALYIAYIRKAIKNGLSDYDAQIATLQLFANSGAIDFWEVLP